LRPLDARGTGTGGRNRAVDYSHTADASFLGGEADGEGWTADGRRQTAGEQRTGWENKKKQARARKSSAFTNASPPSKSKWREPLAETQPTVVSDGVTESWRGAVRLLAGCPVVRTQEGFV